MVKAEWSAAESAKFALFRDYVLKHYNFERSDRDDSKDILAGIMATIKDADDEVSDESNSKCRGGSHSHGNRGRLIVCILVIIFTEIFGVIY